MPSPSPWSDERLDTVLGNLLRYGVILASAVVFIGSMVYVWYHGAERPDYKDFHGPDALSHLSGIADAVSERSGAGIIQFGILLLIATPVARVVFSVIAFALQRDRTYIIVTLIVLGVLLYSMFGGS